MNPTISREERTIAGGRLGRGPAMAMRVLIDAARLLGANRLIPISSAHIDGCLHHGDGGVEFAEALAEGGTRVAVPTTLNVGALDLLHPGTVRTGHEATAMARRQMEAYVSMGAEPTFTCAPYQVGHLPKEGAQVAWGESNAIAFVNSVLGARTERYGDFLDACCAVTGRVPLHGLHVRENRSAQVVVDLSSVPRSLVAKDVFFPVLGTWLGMEVGHLVTALVGLPRTVTRDQLKALGASAASTGSVALFHVVGVTPEAPTLDAATQGGAARLPRIALTADRLRTTLDRLTTACEAERVDAVAVGSPHFSLAEFEELRIALRGRRLRVPFFACTARAVVADLEARGWTEDLEYSGITLVADTCIVVAPILPAGDGVLMTNSGKFAHYGPSQTGYEVVYGSLEDCVESALVGRVVRDEAIWAW